MDLFVFIFALFLIRKNVLAVEISMEVQVGGAATPGCIGGDKLTAADLEELGKELEKKIEAALLENPGSDIIITTNFYQGDKFHSTQITNYDATTIANQDLYTCDVTVGMICYWLVRGKFQYSEAEDACRANGNYEVTVIPDENTYDRVVQFLTTKLTTTELFIWIGSEISDETGIVKTEKNVYVKWCPNYPRKNSYNRYFENMVLYLKQESSHVEHGMKNKPSTWSRDVLCSRKQ